MLHPKKTKAQTNWIREAGARGHEILSSHAYYQQQALVAAMLVDPFQLLKNSISSSQSDNLKIFTQKSHKKRG